MKVDRRDFFKLVAGGVAGITASPLPWKLTDDIAIWTQNWSWVPVPPRGEFSYEKTVCTLCPGACGIKVRKVDDRAVKIEGRTDFPLNPGGVCPLGSSGLQLLYDEDIRFPGAMKRVGPRGAGQFVDISWDEAYRILASRISSLRLERRPEAVAAVDGSFRGSTLSLLVRRLLQAVGSPNYVRMPCLEDTYRTTLFLMHGDEGPMAYDLENADCVLSFGAALLDGWGGAGRVMNAWRLWHEAPRRGKVKIFQVESRASITASKADRWVPARPGTEAALALSLAHVLIKEGLYDSDFIRTHTFGFEDWSSTDGKDHRGFKTMVLDGYSPSQVGPIIGLKGQEIFSLALDFARGKAPIALYGKGTGTLNGSLYECMAVHSLNALMGNINKAGGVFIPEPLPLASLPDVVADQISKRGLQRPRLDQGGTKHFPFTESLIQKFTEAIIGNAHSPIDTLLIFASNPSYSLPDGGAFQRALERIPFIVSFSPFRDETSLMADLVMPDHTYLEKQEDRVWPLGLQYPLYTLSRPVVGPVYNTRNSGDVILRIAGQIGGTVRASFPWNRFEEVLKVRAKGLYDSGKGSLTFDPNKPVWKTGEGSSPKSRADSFDSMWDQLKSGGFWYQGTRGSQTREGIFKTPTGKFEFFTTRFEALLRAQNHEVPLRKTLKEMGIHKSGDEAFMPHYEEMRFHGEKEEFPLVLVPYELIFLPAGRIPAPPFLYKLLSDHQLRKRHSFVEIHPETASKYGLKEGDYGLMESPKGQLEVRIHLFPGAMPGVVYLPFGLGHRAYDELIGNKGANPNELIDARQDPLSGLTAWWRTQVKIVKI